MVGDINIEQLLNPQNLTTIIAILMILIDVSIVLIGMIYLLFGFLYGTRKSLRRGLSFIVPFILFVASIDLITKIIVNSDISYFVRYFMDVEGTMSLKELGAYYLGEYLYSGNIDIASSSKILELGESLVTTVIRTIIYVIGLITIALIVAPFIRFIAWLTYKVQIKGQPKQKMHISSRFAGMGIASIRYTIFLFILIIPLYGTVSTVSMVLDDAVIVAENIEQDNINLSSDVDTIEEYLKSAQKGFNFSITKKLLNITKNDAGATIDMIMLGQVATIKTEDASLNLLEEYANVHQITPTIGKFIVIATNDEEINYYTVVNSLTKDDVDVVKETVKKSQLIDILLPVGFDYLEYYAENQKWLDAYGITKEDLSKIDINKDFDTIMDATSLIASTIVSKDLAFENEAEFIEIVMTDKDIYNIFQTFITNVLDTTLVQNAGLPFACSVIQKSIDVSYESPLYKLRSLFTPEKLDLYLRNDVATVIEITKEMYATDLKVMINGLIQGEELNKIHIDLSDPEIVKVIEESITKLMALNIIHGNENKILESLFYLLDQKDIDISEILYDENGQGRIDWDNETLIVSETVVIILETWGENLFVKLEDINVLLETLLDSNNAPQIVDKITKSEIVKTLFEQFVYDAIQENNELPSEIKKILTREAIAEAFEKDIYTLVNQLQKLYDSKLKDALIELLQGKKFNPELIDFNDDETNALLKETLTTIINLTILEGNQEIIIEILLDNIEGLEIDTDKVLYKSSQKYIDWDNEVNVLYDAFVEMYVLFDGNFTDLSFETFEEKLLSDKTKIEEFVSIVSKSEIVRRIVIQVLPDVIRDANMLSEELLNFFNEYKFAKLENKDEFQKEITLLLTSFVDLLELGISDFESFNITNENKDLLKTVITNLLDSVFIKDNEKELFELFINSTNFTEILESNGITLDYNNITDWKKELTISIDVALGFMDISTSEDFELSTLFEGNMSPKEVEKVVYLFDKIGESELFKPIVYQLIDNIGYDIEITEIDKELIEQNGFGNEIETLLNVIGDAQTLLEAEDLSTLNGSDVENIMIKASNGIITSKVVGSLLEVALGPDGLNINPVDESGNSKYDFSDPKVLKEQASNIANLIDLANSVSNFDIENAESITDVTGAIKNLESNELASDVVKELTGVDVNLENIDIEKEATLIEDAYAEYENSENKENFEMTPELAQKIEESELAKSILEMLGIIK